jgi:hypothetical protein
MMQLECGYDEDDDDDDKDEDESGSGSKVSWVSSYMDLSASISSFQAMRSSCSVSKGTKGDGGVAKASRANCVTRDESAQRMEWWCVSYAAESTFELKPEADTRLMAHSRASPSGVVWPAVMEFVLVWKAGGKSKVSKTNNSL